MSFSIEAKSEIEGCQRNGCSHSCGKPATGENKRFYEAFQPVETFLQTTAQLQLLATKHYPTTRKTR